MEPWWNDIYRENQRTQRKNYPTATLTTTNNTRIDLDMNYGLRSETPATNSLSSGTARCKTCSCILRGKKIEIV
jgi:hypothetical protein